MFCTIPVVLDILSSKPSCSSTSRFAFAVAIRNVATITKEKLVCVLNFLLSSVCTRRPLGDLSDCFESEAFKQTFFNQSLNHSLEVWKSHSVNLQYWFKNVLYHFNENMDNNDQWFPVLHQSQLCKCNEGRSMAHVFPVAELSVEINQRSGLELPVRIF